MGLIKFNVSFFIQWEHVAQTYTLQKTLCRIYVNFACAHMDSVLIPHSK